jgi:hypothetical protein
MKWTFRVVKEKGNDVGDIGGGEWYMVKQQYARITNRKMHCRVDVWRELFQTDTPRTPIIDKYKSQQYLPSLHPPTTR